MKNVPQSASELRAALAAIFPSLPRGFGACGESVFTDAGPTYSSVLREFAYFFARDISEFPDRQLRRFAEFLARCLDAGGELGEAVESCFLEHTRQPRVQARLQPFLAAAQKKVSADPAG